MKATEDSLFEAMNVVLESLAELKEKICHFLLKENIAEAANQDACLSVEVFDGKKNMTNETDEGKEGDEVEGDEDEGYEVEGDEWDEDDA